MGKPSRKPTSEDVLTELQLMLAVYVVALVKTIAGETGARSGDLVCPICRTGRVQWTLAPNGHAHVRCDRTLPDGSHCVNAIE